MDLNRNQLTEITEYIEDTVEHLCDEHILSGQCVWTVVECLAVSKLAELRGDVLPSKKTK